MDTNETTVETQDVNFPKEIAKALALGTATSAGVLAGFMVVGLAVVKIQELKEARKAKKEAKIEK